MQKEYKKLTADEFREILDFLPESLSMLRGMNADVASVLATKFDGVMTDDYGLYSRT